MSVVMVELDNVSLEVQMGLEELLVEYVQAVHDQLHLLQAWHRGPGPSRKGVGAEFVCPQSANVKDATL
jgi:hypothetical protein